MLSLNAHSKTSISGYILSYFKDLFAEKRTLVKLELDLIPQVQAEWQRILRNTNTDREKAQTSIKACYQYAGLSEPTIIWADNPLNVIKILIDRPHLCDVSDEIVNKIWQSELEIQKYIDTESALRILAQIDPQYTLSTNKGTKQISSIADRLNEIIISQMNDLYVDLTQRTIPSPLQHYRVGDLAYFDYFLRIGVAIPQIQPSIDLAKACGWCWAFEKVAILTPKPSKVRIDRQGEIVGIIYNGIDILTEQTQLD
jgi:hypothetical protein